MGKKVKRKLTIEIHYYDTQEALLMLDKLHQFNINELKPLMFTDGDTIMKTESRFYKPVIEGREEVINGSPCVVYPSSINFD